MLIKCKNCSAVYQVPEESLALKRPHFFKCDACGCVFPAPTPDLSEPDSDSLVPPVEQSDVVPMALSEIFKDPPMEEIPQPANETQKTLPLNEDKADDDLKEETKQDADLFAPITSAEEFTPVTSKSSGNGRFIAAFVAFVLTFGAILYLLYVGRYFFVRQAPITEKLYQKAGVSTEVLGEGLAFQNTLFDIQKNGQNYGLLIKSQLVNTTNETKNAPNVTVFLLDENNAVVGEKQVELSKSLIESGAPLKFEAYLDSLPASARRIEMTFERKQQ